MRLAAKFDGGKCSAGCGVPIRKGDEIEYDYESKTARHADCEPPCDATEELAARLGYLPYKEAGEKDWTTENSSNQK